jgi:hypothetical protein
MGDIIMGGVKPNIGHRPSADRSAHARRERKHVRRHNQQQTPEIPTPLIGNNPPRVENTPPLAGTPEQPVHVVTDAKKRDWTGYAIMGGVSVLAGGSVVVGNNMYQNHKQEQLRQDYTA